MARKGMRYSQQDPVPSKGVKKDCAECQRLFQEVKYIRWVRRNSDRLAKNGTMSWIEIGMYARQERPMTADLKAHVTTHLPNPL